MGNGGRDSGNWPERKFALIVFTLLVCAGVGTLVWLAVDDPSRRDSLADAADWLMKGGVGALVGLLIERRNRG